MGAETSKPAGAVNLGLVALVAAGAAGGAGWAVPIGAETSRPVTSSSGTSSRARLLRTRSSTVGDPVRPDGQAHVVADEDAGRGAGLRELLGRGQGPVGHPHMVAVAAAHGDVEGAGRLGVAALMTSALLRNGPDHLRPLQTQVRDWMDRHGSRRSSSSGAASASARSPTRPPSSGPTTSGPSPPTACRARRDGRFGDGSAVTYWRGANSSRAMLSGSRNDRLEP
jgi:hypothetical protein